MDNRESMKRVLMGLKGEARKMRKEGLSARLSRVSSDQDDAVDAVKLPSIGKPGPKSLDVVVAQAAPNEELAEETVQGNKAAIGDDDADLKRVLKKFNL